MRTIAAIVSLMILVAAGLPAARAGEAETVGAISKAAAALDQAFERQDQEAVKRLMTPDHIAVTPYYDGVQTVADQLASLPDLQYEQKADGKPPITVLGPDAAMRTFTADLKGSLSGKSIASKVFVSEVWVKADGAWVEKFYQVTTLQP
jgi:ketosteroid isomerase-like protein